MPDNKNQNVGNRNKNQGVERENQQGGDQSQQQGNRGNQGDRNVGRQQQGNRGQQQGNKGSTQIERDNVSSVGNDNDLDRDLEREDMDEERITQRNPRMGEGNEGQRQGGDLGGSDRDRNRE